MATEINQIINTTEFTLTVTGPNNFSGTVEAYSTESYSSPIAIGGFNDAVVFDLDSGSSNATNKVFESGVGIRYTFGEENDSLPLPFLTTEEGYGATTSLTMYVTILPQSTVLDTWVIGAIETGTSEDL